MGEGEVQGIMLSGFGWRGIEEHADVIWVERGLDRIMPNESWWGGLERIVLRVSVGGGGGVERLTLWDYGWGV